MFYTLLLSSILSFSLSLSLSFSFPFPFFFLVEKYWTGPCPLPSPSSLWHSFLIEIKVVKRRYVQISHLKTHVNDIMIAICFVEFEWIENVSGSKLVENKLPAKKGVSLSCTASNHLVYSRLYYNKLLWFLVILTFLDPIACTVILIAFGIREGKRKEPNNNMPK